MTAYYNENDPKAAEWLRELIKAGLIAPGEVDERSVKDVVPTELSGFTQCHFFAGIGGWSHALRLAGWSDERPVWTGSCPCQPFSTAGKGDGFDDERHLWPFWFHLIEQCQPSTIFGEQVASKSGREWFGLVQADLEALGYAVGRADVCAAGVGAPHWRQRLWFVGMGNASGSVSKRRSPEALGSEESSRGVTQSNNNRPIDAGEGVRRMGDSNLTGSQGRPIVPERTSELTTRSGSMGCNTSPLNGFWANADWLGCTDGKWRPVEPGTFPLAHGVPERVGLLRGYGNAIVPQVAQKFIESVM